MQIFFCRRQTSSLIISSYCLLKYWVSMRLSDKNALPESCLPFKVTVNKNFNNPTYVLYWKYFTDTQTFFLIWVFVVELFQDIMSVISYTDGIARVFATQLLFHYWPHFHSTSNRHKLNSNYGKPYLYTTCLHRNTSFFLIAIAIIFTV